MSDILDKISSYNIFNYLLPGTLFAVIADHLTDYSFRQDDILAAVFVYYFIGLIISRVGSLVVEPLLKRSGFVTFAPYGEFVAASKSDSKLDVLSETNNMYRTLCALFLFVLATVGYEWLEGQLSWLSGATPYLLAIGLLALFLAAYRKQTTYIYQRIRARTARQGSPPTPPDPPGTPKA